MKQKGTYSIELEEAMHTFLEQMAEKYGLEDVSKAVRCLVNYARDEPEKLDDIFEEIRCLDC